MHQEITWKCQGIPLVQLTTDDVNATHFATEFLVIWTSQLKKRLPIALMSNTHSAYTCNGIRLFVHDFSDGR